MEIVDADMSKFVDDTLPFRIMYPSGAMTFGGDESDETTDLVRVLVPWERGPLPGWTPTPPFWEIISGSGLRWGLFLVRPGLEPQVAFQRKDPELRLLRFRPMSAIGAEYPALSFPLLSQAYERLASHLSVARNSKGSAKIRSGNIMPWPLPPHCLHSDEEQVLEHGRRVLDRLCLGTSQVIWSVEYENRHQTIHEGPGIWSGTVALHRGEGLPPRIAWVHGPGDWTGSDILTRGYRATHVYNAYCPGGIHLRDPNTKDAFSYLILSPYGKWKSRFPAQNRITWRLMDQTGVLPGSERKCFHYLVKATQAALALGRPCWPWPLPQV